MPDSDQDYDKVSVNLWVDPERKDRWEAYLEEESEFQYLSQLIRQTVEREIKQSRDGANTIELSEHVATEFDDLHDSIDDLGQVIQEVEKRLSGLEREVRDDPKARQLANEVFEILPTRSDIKDWQTEQQGGSIPSSRTVFETDSGRIDTLADRLGAQPREVRAALDRLQQDTHQVHTMDYDGETVYYKEG